MINWILFHLFIDGHVYLNSQCILNDKLELSYYPMEIPTFSAASLSASISNILYVSWDLVTLLLYIYKIRSFHQYRNKESVVHKRIISILHKITILTMFYEFTALLVIIVMILVFVLDPDQAVDIATFYVPSYLVSIAVSYSMFLMMDHNLEIYIKFLQIVRFLRLHYICFCWKHMVIDQLDLLVMNGQKKLAYLVNTPSPTSQESNNNECDPSKKSQNQDNNDAEINGMELSVATECQ